LLVLLEQFFKGKALEKLKENTPYFSFIYFLHKVVFGLWQRTSKKNEAHKDYWAHEDKSILRITKAIFLSPFDDKSLINYGCT
jgi:hypothetical protein